jgi:tetratricopeptide (TPR) repeat protein
MNPFRYKQLQIQLCIAYVAICTMTMVGTQAETTSGGDIIWARGEIVMAEGRPRLTTADGAQQRMIRQLLATDPAARKPAHVTVDYPLEGSIFPPEMIPPTFLWHDRADSADSWLIHVVLPDTANSLDILVPGMAPPEGRIDRLAISSTNEVYVPTPYQASARAWTPSPEVWQAIKAGSVDTPATLTFYGYNSADTDHPASRGDLRISTSRDPVGAPIFYRDVPLAPPQTKEGIISPLPKGALPLIGWRLRDIARTESNLLLTDMPTCANCHSFSQDGATLALDVDGPSGDKGAYAITSIEKDVVIEDDDIITWNSFPDKLEGHKTLGFLSRIRPDGSYVLSTVNEAIFVVNFPDFRFGQVFYPTRGILAYYSIDSGEIKALPGAADPDYVQTDGVWTPDGKTVVFARARAKDPYVKGAPLATYANDPQETQIQYDLYRMPFNEGRGGTPERIIGASDNGMSNTFPKVSPDGKWLVFTKCRNGQLMRPDGRLWIVPLAGGEAREMTCNTDLMNSWHSFSPNGRWMVFSSKSRTPYTQMFLTHIDDAGNDSPAILIENSTAANRAINIPEFVNVDPDDFQSIRVPAVDHYRHFHKGSALAIEGRNKEALAEFEKAIEMVDDDSRIHDSISRVLLRLGQDERALKHIEESLRINPYNIEMHTNYAFLLSGKGQGEKAEKHLGLAIKLYPRLALSWYNRASLYLQHGKLDAALADFSEAITLRRGYADAYTGRGVVLKTQGDFDGALTDFGRALELIPTRAAPRFFRAMILFETGDFDGALDDLNKALEAGVPEPPRRIEIESLRDRILERQAAGQADRK